MEVNLIVSWMYVLVYIFIDLFFINIYYLSENLLDFLLILDCFGMY